MSPKVNMNRASDEAVWHAMSQARVVAPLATDPEKGLSLAEASAGFRNMKYGPNRLPEGGKWGPAVYIIALQRATLVSSRVSWFAEPCSVALALAESPRGR